MKKLLCFSLPAATNPSALTWALLGAVRNSEMQKKFYPGWTCRFYAASELPEKIARALEQNGGEIVIMNDDELREIPPSCWRLLAAADSDVELCLMRSAVSCFGWREKRMVDEWLASGKAFHIIRDHRWAARAIVPDSYGVRGGCLPNVRELVKKRSEYPGSCDRIYLQSEIYPHAVGDVLIHCDFLRLPGEEVVPTSPPLTWEEENPPWVGCDLPHFPREYYSKYGLEIKPRDATLPPPFSNK